MESDQLSFPKIRFRRLVSVPVRQPKIWESKQLSTIGAGRYHQRCPGLHCDTPTRTYPHSGTGEFEASDLHGWNRPSSAD
jgi:hypothetical protein